MPAATASNTIRRCGTTSSVRIGCRTPPARCEVHLRRPSAAPLCGAPRPRHPFCPGAVRGRHPACFGPRQNGSRWAPESFDASPRPGARPSTTCAREGRKKNRTPPSDRHLPCFFFQAGAGGEADRANGGGGGLAVAGRAGQWGAWRRRRLAGRGPDGVCVRACVRSSMHACVLLTRHECDARTSRRVLPGREQNGRAPRRPALTCHPSSRWVLSPGARSRALMAMLCDALYYIWSAKGFRRGTMAFSQWLKKPHCDEPWPRPSGPSRCGSHGGKTVSFEYGRTACP